MVNCVGKRLTDFGLKPWCQSDTMTSTKPCKDCFNHLALMITAICATHWTYHTPGSRIYIDRP
eukprot:224514-Hanusia_phi.AAC.1